MSEQTLGRVTAIMRRLPPAPRTVVGVEVGVFQGRMSAGLLRAHVGLHLYMVDNWLPADEQPSTYRVTRDSHAHMEKRVQERNARNAVRSTAFASSRRTILRQASLVAASSFKPGSVDFVFLDGDHSYTGVMVDIEAWRPAIRAGGWLCGHDYSELYGPDKQYDFQVKAAVDDAAAAHGWALELDEDSTWFVRL